jgi:predicted anti-sigma-YlaC factor YlaD
MSLSKEQVKTLLSVVAGTTDDSLDCDGCFGHVSQFVEMKLAGMNLCESMKMVQTHLENCPCCQDEFEALLAAIREVGGCEASSQTPPPV